MQPAAKKKLCFITGTRADYGKLKPLINIIMDEFAVEIFVTGMHLLKQYGHTYMELEKDGFGNLVYQYINQHDKSTMDEALANTIQGFSNYLRERNPDAIIVHGDRIEALAAALSGTLNNILVIHIEGGEISGTIDESIRHAITKFAHIHMVSNDQSRQRIISMGEKKENIFVVGSPDIDVMLMPNLPDLLKVKQHYEISFDDYAMVLYHPVTTRLNELQQDTANLVDALIESARSYVVVFPNNDNGSEVIIQQYAKLNNNNRFRVYPSISFESFLVLLKNAQFIIGNSSAGIRESGVYGVPAIDIGIRQQSRYQKDTPNIQHIEQGADRAAILHSITKAHQYKSKPAYHFGNGNSALLFKQILLKNFTWNIDLQKRFT